MNKELYISSLFGGCAAGLSCDMLLFPLDTIKTRLQAPQGFLKAGGFKGIYKGIGPVMAATGPHSALYFVTYDAFKHKCSPCVHSNSLPFVYMVGGSLAEIVACSVRVPMEVIKQRRQVVDMSTAEIAITAYKKEGILGFYRGFGSTLIRDCPFSFIQFPIWEYLKVTYKNYKKAELSSIDVANCGALAGGIAAVLTTPLDVVKTRIMVADAGIHKHHLKFSSVLISTYNEKGIKGLFAGLTPRFMWITIGSYIFFGVYDFAKNICCEKMLASHNL